MREWIWRLVLLGAVVVLVALPAAWRGQSQPSAEDALRLVIVTPHNEQIRYEMARAFSAWHAEEFGREVIIDWRSSGGTSDIHRILRSQYAALFAADRMDEGIGCDLVFGGGDYFFDRQLKRLKLPDAAGTLQRVSILQPLKFEPEFVRSVYPGEKIADKKLYDVDGHWWGVVLSSFGIVYNRDVLSARGMAEPQSWSDLTHPSYFGWVALADPAHSGSVRTTYEAIVQRYGFEEGWATLRRVFANARYFTASSQKVPTDVAAGEAAAGMCIDFYGRFQSQAVGGRRVGFVAPVGMTVVSADPVAVLRGAPHRELAQRFVHFLLTRRGQAVWSFRRGDELGPQRFELRRAPVRPDMYAHDLSRMVDQVNPFEIARELPPGTPGYFAVIPTVLHAMAMDVHDELKAAWQALAEEDDPQVRDRMLALFEALPFDAEDLAAAPGRWKADPHAEDTDRRRWTAFFAARYRAASALAGP